jgi:adenylate cyclase
MASTKPSQALTRDEKIDALINWMISGAPPHANAKGIIAEICARLLDIGLPVDRFGLFIWTLHPNLQGRRFLWKRDPGEVTVADAPMGMFSTEIYTSNPLPHVIESRQMVRRHLEDPECPDDYIIVGELREQGFTDYVVFPLVYINGETHACTWSCATPGGFSEFDLEILDRIKSPLARLTEAYMLRLDAANLLSTYVGRNSGGQILDGKVHRGDGTQISAVILFSDLKGFTELSNRVDGQTLVQLLNDTFDCLVPPVAAHGGEILKFMGDGFFAIFPTRDGVDIAGRVRAAMQATREGRAALSGADIANKVDFRTAIHHGTFHYGNVGGADRLDFTAIGPPVNLAARLLSAATEFDRDDVLSTQAAEHVSDQCERAGEIMLKGFAEPQTVWTY